MAVKEALSPPEETSDPAETGSDHSPPPGYDSGDEQSTIGSLHNPRLRLQLRQIRRQVSRRRSVGDGRPPRSGSLSELIGRHAAAAAAPAPAPAEQPGDEVVIDGGYGWVVAFGAFLANFCIAGTVKSYGLLNLMVIETFGVSAAEAAVVPSLLLTIGLLISPVVGALCERFTCRKVVTAGGIFCFLGFALGSLSTNITHLCLTVGVLGGIGTGCATTPGILITTRYFPTRRSMVNGLVLAGNAAGGFALPPLYQLLLAEFGLRGTLLVIGALCLHVVAGAALARPIAVHETVLRRRRQRQRRQRDVVDEAAVAPRRIPSYTSLDTGLETAEYREKHSPSQVSLSSRLDITDECFVKRLSHSSLASRPAPSEERFLQQCHASLASRCDSHDGHLTKRPLSLASLAERLSFTSAPASDQRRDSLVPRPAEAPTHLVRVVRPGPDGHPTPLLVQVPARLRTSSLLLSTTDVTTDATSQFNDDLRRLREGGDVVRAAPVPSRAPYALMQLPVFGVSRGLSRAQTAEILSLVSAVDLVSRLCFGWLFDQGLFRRQHAFAASQLLGGVSVLLLPLVSSYGAILSLFVVYSVGIGTWFVNLAPVLADHHGIDKIASSYGLVRMFHGLSTLAMPPLFGVLVDRTGDYGTQFYGIGSCMVVAGLLVVGVSVTSLDQKYGVRQETETGEQPEVTADQRDAVSEQHDHEDVANQPIAEEEE
ncbi:Monocarboxylate transporter 12 [Amphibalanus amphitrite]|uniref:Monocarboxylate transporter 12 n=1 Tax=Amphibalanus amphitrite TaxID=1232801 RepID=A0A6A4W0T9_AMPAM|nr:Monocarboxylate transporter 12 [Amphibalanus amphitrite]